MVFDSGLGSLFDDIYIYNVFFCSPVCVVFYRGRRHVAKPINNLVLRICLFLSTPAVDWPLFFGYGYPALTVNNNHVCGGASVGHYWSVGSNAF